jgi:peroxiredoxin Q/BCP
VRELREFRVAHDRFAEQGLVVAGVNRDTPESNDEWAQKLDLPYPLLADVDRKAGEAFRVLRRVGVGGWSVEMFRRSTFLIDAQGLIAAVWGNVKVRGHAAQVLAAAHALEGGRLRTEPTSPSPPSA